MKIIFYGGEKAGMITLLALNSISDIKLVIAEDDVVYDVAKQLKLNVDKVPKDINSYSYQEKLELVMADLFICCHARQILKKYILNWYEDKCIRQKYMKQRDILVKKANNGRITLEQAAELKEINQLLN